MNILTIALNDFKILLKNKLQFAMLLLMPLLMIAMMGYALKGMFNPDNSIHKFKVLYINEDKGSIGRSFDDFIKNEAAKFIEVVPGDIDSAEQQVASGKYSNAIILPSGLSEKFENGHNANIDVISSGQDEVKDSIIRSIVDSFTSFSGVTAEIFKGYRDFAGDINTLEISESMLSLQTKYGVNFVESRAAELQGKDKISSFQYFTLSMLLFFMLMSGMGVGVGIVTDRADSMHDRISSYPVKDKEYLMGKILGNFFLTALQAVTVIIFTSFALKVNWGYSFMGIGLTIVLIMLISSSIGLLFSSIVSSPKVMNTSMVITIWMIAFISGGFTPVPALLPIARFTFYKWGMDSLTVFMTGGSFMDAAKDLGLLTATVLVLSAIGLVLYRRRGLHE